MPHHNPEADPEQCESDRLEALHFARIGTDAMSASLGSADEWLGTAQSHLAIQMSGRRSGSVEVSVAALHVVIMRLEQLEHGGEAWLPSPSCPSLNRSPDE